MRPFLVSVGVNKDASPKGRARNALPGTAVVLIKPTVTYGDGVDTKSSASTKRQLNVYEYNHIIEL